MGDRFFNDFEAWWSANHPNTPSLFNKNTIEKYREVTDLKYHISILQDTIESLEKRLKSAEKQNLDLMADILRDTFKEKK